MGMDGMKNKCAVGIYKIEKKNVDAIDQRERRMEKMRLLLIHVVLLSVLLVGGSIGAKPVQAAEANPVDIENAQIIHKNDIYLAKVPKVQIDKVSYKAGTDDVGTSDSDSMQQDLLSDLPLSDIQDVLQENTGTENIYFRELVKSLMLADANTDKQELFRQILRSAFGDVEEGRQVFVQILLLTAACAFLQNFINVFENSQISKTGFYLYFLLLMGLLLRSYLLIHGILEGVLDQVISFMEALLPGILHDDGVLQSASGSGRVLSVVSDCDLFDRACAVVCGDPGDSCVCSVTDVELYDGGKADFTNDGVIEAGIDLGDASVAGGSDRHECD